MDNNIEICDLTKIIPEKRIVKIEIKKERMGLFWDILRRFGYKGKTVVKVIDISTVSTRNTVAVEKYLVEFGEATQANDFEVVEEKMYEIMLTICRPSWPEVTKEIIAENTTPEQIQELFQFIILPITARAMGVEDKVKKAVAAYLQGNKK